MDLYNKMKTEFSSAEEEEVSLGVYVCTQLSNKYEPLTKDQCA